MKERKRAPEGEGKRPTRIAAQVRQELASLVSRDLSDPRLAGLVVSAVTLTPDLRLAKVYWRMATIAEGPARAEEQALAEKALVRASGRLRKAVTARLGLRYAPELRFHYDAGQEARDRIDSLLEEIKKP